MKCEDCGRWLINLDEEESGLCADCNSGIYGYDEDDEADDRLQYELDGD